MGDRVTVEPLIEMPPPVRLYHQGSWGPKAIHRLVAPHAGRDPNTTGS